MTKKESQFHADDKHPIQPTSADIMLRQQLEHSISKYFYEGCDRIIHNLLSNCRWYATTHASILTPFLSAFLLPSFVAYKEHLIII